MVTTNEKQFKRVAFDDFLLIKVKGKRAMLPILVLSHFFSKEGEIDPKERGIGSQQLSIQLEKELLWCYDLGLPFFAQFGEEWPYCNPRVPPIVHFRKFIGLRTRLNLSHLTPSQFFLTRKSQKSKIVIPPFEQQEQFIVKLHYYVIKLLLLFHTECQKNLQNIQPIAFFF